MSNSKRGIGLLIVLLVASFAAAQVGGSINNPGGNGSGNMSDGSGSVVAGQTPTTTTSAHTYTAVSPGFPDSVNSPVTSASQYTVACDSSSTLVDRAHSVHFGSGADSTELIPSSSASGCSGGFFSVLYNDTGASLTFNRSGSDTFSVYTGTGAATTGATSFALTNGQFAKIKNGSGTVWTVEVFSSASGSLPTTTDPATNAYFQDDFECGGAAGSTSGCLNWQQYTVGSAAFSQYTGSVGNYWGAITLATGATNPSTVGLKAVNFANYNNYTQFTGGVYKARVLLSSTTNIDFLFGIYDSNNAPTEASAAGYAGIAYNVGKSDTGWMCVASIDGTAPNTTRTAISGTLNTTAWHTLTITWTAAKTIQCQVDGGTATSLASTNFPTDNGEIPAIAVTNNATANNVNVTVDYIYHNLTGISR